MTPKNSLFFGLVMLMFAFNCFYTSLGHSHAGHSHDHSNAESEEPASFKYSREANIPYKRDTIDQDGQRLFTSTKQDHPPKSRDVLTLWVESLVSTLLISAAPFFILFFIPIDNRVEHQPNLKILLSFASGGLLGDAFLHLIPHALLSNSKASGSHSHSHSHSGESDVHGHDLSVGLWVLAGILVFLMVEKFVRIVKGGHGHSHGHNSHVYVETSEKKDADSNCTDSKECKENVSLKGKDQCVKRKGGSVKINEASGEQTKSDKTNSSSSEIVEQDIKVAGYLNLAADFTHNFTDGLAIGASYLAGKSVGMITTATILLHEVPHEIGDFAILIQSGCSKRKAIFLQLTTAVGALTGTVCSLLAEGMDPSATTWILPFTAGGFIYIATVSVIPELLEDTKFWQSVKEVIALLVGVSMMVLIAEYE